MAQSRDAAFVPIGKIENFDLDKGDWVSYQERLEQYFIVNNIKGIGDEESATDEQKVAIFLTLIGGRTYSLLRDLVSPEKPAQKKYFELVEVLKTHFKPKPIMIAERFKFQQRVQKPDEYVTEYLAQLRKMTEYCEFKDYLEQALRDRFVSGIKSAAIQRKLLSQEGLDLAKALSIAQSMEAAEAQSSQLRQVTGFSSQPLGEKEVHAVTTAGKRKGSHEKGQRKPCYQCGGTADMVQTNVFIKRNNV